MLIRPWFVAGNTMVCDSCSYTISWFVVHASTHFRGCCYYLCSKNLMPSVCAPRSVLVHRAPYDVLCPQTDLLMVSYHSCPSPRPVPHQTNMNRGNRGKTGGLDQTRDRSPNYFELPFKCLYIFGAWFSKARCIKSSEWTRLRAGRPTCTVH